MRTPYQLLEEETKEIYELSNILMIGISVGKLGNLVEFDDIEEFKKLVNHSIEADSFDINNYKNKKAFIIPGCERTQKRIKDMMSELDIKIVKDYEDADFFLSNNNINRMFSKNNIFYDINEHLAVSHHLDTKLLLPYKFYEWEEAKVRTINNRKINSYFIGGLYFNLRNTGKDFVPLYHFLNISQDVVLDEDMVEYLTGMIESNNKDDISVVKKILPKIDVSKNQNILFKFFDDCLTRYKYSFQRDKDVRNWIEESGVMEWHKEPSSIIEDYHNKGFLSNEGFKYLEAKNRELLYISGGSLYNFKVSLKDEYKKYLK
tara:strand:- start:4551 stop:5504 length:954 start_codon:yes stop_codon:yes gene_type:complete